MNTGTVDKVEASLASFEEQLDPVIDNVFSDGLYGRVMYLNAGDSIVGKRHKHNHLAILLSGSIAVLSKYGRCIYEAPYIVQVNAGDKRAFLALSDIKYITLHATTETDLSKLEAQLTED